MAKAKAKKATKIKQVKSVYLIAEDTMREMITMLHAMRCDLAGHGRVIELREKMAEQAVTIRRLLEEKAELGRQLADKSRAQYPVIGSGSVKAGGPCPVCGIWWCTVHSTSVGVADRFVRGES